MSGLCFVTTQLDDGSGSFPYDISQYVRMVDGVKIVRGRGDELSAVQAASLNLTLDNVDGRFTAGSAAYNCAPDQRIVVATTINQSGNLLSANAASVETSVADWTSQALFGTVATFAQSATRAQDGTKSVLITWPTTGTGSFVGTLCTNLVPGQQYTASAYVYAPTGAPDPRLQVAFGAVGTRTSTKNAFTRITVTFTATQTSHYIGVQVATATAGQQCFVDAAMVNQGASALTFTTASAGASIRFYGYVKSWPTVWPNGDDTFAVAAITAVDLQERLSRHILDSVIVEEHLKDAPAALYRLNEPAGETHATDYSGNMAPPLTLAGDATLPVVFGSATGTPTDGATAAQFQGGQYLTTNAPTGTQSLDLAFLRGSTVMTQPEALIDAPGAWLLSLNTGGQLFLPVNGQPSITGSTNVADGRTHHVAVSGIGTATTTLYLDGAAVGTTGAVATPGTLNVGGPGFATLTGVISNVALNTASITARISDYYHAALDGFVGNATGFRISRLLGYTTANGFTGDVGQVAPGFVDFTGQSVWDQIQALADAENGIVQCANDGTVRLFDKFDALPSLTPAMTLDVNQIDETVAPVLDMQNVFNIGTGKTNNGAPQVIRDAASITTHERYAVDKTYLVQTDGEAATRIQWLVNTHKAPLVRVPGLTIDLLTATQAQQITAQTLDLADTLQVTGWPSQSPTGSSATFLLDGWTETISASEWTLACNVTNAAPYRPWILGDATYGVLGSTTVLYV